MPVEKLIKQSDGQFLSGITEELYKRFFIDALYRRLDLSTTQVDTLYNESPTRKYLDHTEIPIYITRPSNTQLLTRYGQDNDTLREIWLSKIAVDKLGFIPKTGDLIYVTPGSFGDQSQDIFHIDVVNTPSWWITYGFIFQFQLMCSYLRGGVKVEIES